MSTALALRVATFIVVADGLVALYLGDFLGLLGLGLIGAAVVWGWWREPLRERIEAVPGLHATLVTLAALGSLFDLIYLAGTVLDGLVRLLVFLLLYRVYMRRSLRDVRDAGFLAFFMLVAAAPVSVGVGYLGVFLTFLFAGTWMLMLYHVLSESERTEANPAVALGRDLLRLSVVAWVATLTITGTLFFIIPRIGHASLPRRPAANRMVSGFSERVELGSFGTIELDETVVMRVSVPAGVPPEQLLHLRWRGLAFDRFDGHAWTASRTRERGLRAVAGHFEVDPLRSGGPFLTQEIYLEPIGSDVIFGAPRMVRVATRTDTLRVDDTGSVSVPLTVGRIHYVVQSQLEEPLGDGAAGAVAWPVAGLSAAETTRYLALPLMPPRIQTLAREITAGSRGPREAALRLTGYLSREIRYTRVLERRTTLDSLEEFLFVVRAGNCEYFAAALAVMLRSVGIPARVVNGFQRGEWNPYGNYFMVRLRDAHSWVEAHLGSGWVTLDPSPRGGVDVFPMPSRFGLYLDALQVRWYRYVVNWSLQDQVGVAFTAHRTFRGWRQRLGRLGDVPVSGETWARLGAVLAGMVAIAVLLLWRQERSGTGVRAATVRMPRFYARALRALARRGLRPERGETAREFCARAGKALPACLPPLRSLTDVYERVRFGTAAMDAGQAAGIDQRLAELHAGSTSSAGARRPLRFLP